MCVCVGIVYIHICICVCVYVGGLYMRGLCVRLMGCFVSREFCFPRMVYKISRLSRVVLR